MIEGHGDDAYKYDGIESDFSSNICYPKDESQRAILEHLSHLPNLLSHYPEPEAWTLERMIAERHGIDPRCVIVTSGATDAIYLVAQALHYTSVIPAPTFREYEDACRMVESRESRVERRARLGGRDEGGESRGGRGSEAAMRGGESLLWLCNPNNPTGEVLRASEIEELLRDYDIVVIDQSYERYTSLPVMTHKSAVRHRRVVQLHSMTKDYAVPGLRLGYIVAAPRLANSLRRHLRPWAVSALAVEAGKYLLQHDELLVQPDLQEAQRLYRELCKIEGIDVMPSHTNFFLCRLHSGTAAQLKDYLAHKHKILIRDASNFRGLTAQHFRIAAQTPSENEALVAALRHFLSRVESQESRV